MVVEMRQRWSHPISEIDLVAFSISVHVIECLPQVTVVSLESFNTISCRVHMRLNQGRSKRAMYIFQPYTSGFAGESDTITA